MELALVGREGCAGELNSGERLLAGGEFAAGQPNYGEAVVVGGDDLFGCFPPAKNPRTVEKRQLR
jgi:hypothetical protein